MSTKITYTDDAGFKILVEDADAVPGMGELVVLFNADEEQGKPYLVVDRFWWVTRASHHQHGRDDGPAYQHVTIVLRERGPNESGRKLAAPE